MKLAAMTANDMADENKSTNNDRLLLAISESSLECDGSGGGGGGGGGVYSPAAILDQVGGVGPSFIEGINTELTGSEHQAASVILSPLQLQVAKLPLTQTSLTAATTAHRPEPSEQLQDRETSAQNSMIASVDQIVVCGQAQDTTNSYSHNFTPPASSLVRLMSTTLSASSNMNIDEDQQQQSQNQLMPIQKKSFFDGASKDEILTYLEDAVERVPELLIAADEVMVMGDNELLLVNQLEPNSPATPISIVETDDELMARASARGDAESQVSTLPFEGHTAQQVNRVLAQTSSTRKRRARGELAAASELEASDHTEQLLTQLDNQSTVFLNDELVRERDGDTTLPPSSRIAENQSQHEHHHHQPLFGPSLSDSSNRSCDEESSPLALPSTVQMGVSARSLSRNHRHHHHHLPATTTRRNSTSAATSATGVGGGGMRSECKRMAARRMALQQHLSNTRDSILTSTSSSTSLSTSTPASNSSPSSNSRSSSSNQTSETSNFYASPSLSCSSPAIGEINQLASLASPGLAQLSSDNDNQLLSCTTTATQLANLFEQGCSTQLLSSTGGFSATGSSVLIDGSHQLITNDNLSSPRPSLECAIDALGLLSVSSNERGDSGFDSASTSSFVKCLNSLPVDKLDDDKTAGIELVSGSLASNSEEPATSRIMSASKPTGNEPAGTVTTSDNKPNSKATGARPATSHCVTINRLNNYLVNRYRACINMGAEANNQSPSQSQNAGQNQSRELAGGNPSDETSAMVEFQCLDCDQFILVDHSRVLHKANELRLLRDSCELESLAEGRNSASNRDNNNQQPQQLATSLSQLDRAYIVALNGLPLCRFCEKKRVERKEIISEFLETELKYGHDLKIIHDEFYRPMQIAGLLNKDQIQGIFSNLDELLVAHCKFAERLKTASVEALAIGDTDYNTVNVGKMFLDQADMLQTFEFYCVRQASAACLLARLAKERDLLRIFLRVSQMENTLLRRMNLAAFLMVPVQRVTKYPLLLNRLYKVTPYYHKDREALRAAQLKVELHLEHINHQTKGISATNKIWRRISNLSTGQALISARTRGLISAEDISYMKLRKTALELLKWDREETQFIHSGELSFAPLNEYLIRQKMKSVRYMSAQALLIVVGKPNWRYRPDLIKSHIDYKLLTPTPGGSGIKEAALLLFREKNGRFIACREPLLLSNCVLCTDCSQYNNEPSHGGAQVSKQTATGTTSSSNITTTSSSSNNNISISSSVQTSFDNSKTQPSLAVTAAQNSFSSSSSSLMSRRSSPATTTANGQPVAQTKKDLATLSEVRAASADTQPTANLGQHASGLISASNIRSILISHKTFSSTAAAAANQCRSVQSKSFSLSSRDSTEMTDQVNSQSHSDTVSMTSLKSLPEGGVNSSSSKRRTSPPPAQSSRSNSLASASSQTSMASTSSAASMNPPFSKPLSCASNKLNPFKSKSNTAAANANSLAGNKLVATAATAQASGKRTTATDGVGAATNSQDPTNTSSSRHIPNGITGQQQHPATLSTSSKEAHGEGQHHLYNHHFFHINHQPYGDYEESFEIHERLSKESLLLRADTPLKTRYWLQMLRYHAKDLGHWRQRRPALANIMMMMRQE